MKRELTVSTWSRENEILDCFFPETRVRKRDAETGLNE